MSHSLLAHIAGNFISQYENVANSSIAYLLNTYPVARIALAKITGLDEVPVRYVTELAAGENGRPDVTGVNGSGEKRIIIEGKFWANLTPNQPSNYLHELAAGGRLLFLAPGRRRESLLDELGRRNGTPTPDERILVMSWTHFLDAVDQENAREPHFPLACDLAQLRDLCERMDVEGMPPLSASDLDPMNGKIVYQLADLVDGCRDILSRWEPTDFKGLRAGGIKLGYGFYFRAHGLLGCWLIFSARPWFTTKAATPYWLVLGDINFRRSEPALSALAHWDRENTYDSFGDESIAAYAIRLRPGLDRQGAIEHIVERVKAAITVVVSAMEHGLGALV